MIRIKPVNSLENMGMQGYIFWFFGWTFMLWLDFSLSKKRKLRIQQCSSHESSIINWDDCIYLLIPGVDISIMKELRLHTKSSYCGAGWQAVLILFSLTIYHHKISSCIKTCRPDELESFGTGNSRNWINNKIKSENLISNTEIFWNVL